MTGLRESLPPLLDVEPHVMEVTGLSRGTVYRLIRAGDLPAIKLGRLTKIPRDQLLRQLGLIDQEDAA